LSVSSGDDAGGFFGFFDSGRFLLRYGRILRAAMFRSARWFLVA
jgi:hypothetical protein